MSQSGQTADAGAAAALAKLQQLRGYLPFVESIISKLDVKGGPGVSEQLQKMRLLKKFIIAQDAKNCKIATMEPVIKLLQGIYQKHIANPSSSKKPEGDGPNSSSSPSLGNRGRGFSPSIQGSPQKKSSQEPGQSKSPLQGSVHSRNSFQGGNLSKNSPRDSLQSRNSGILHDSARSRNPAQDLTPRGSMALEMSLRAVCGDEDPQLSSMLGIMSKHQRSSASPSASPRASSRREDSHPSQACNSSSVRSSYSASSKGGSNRDTPTSVSQSRAHEGTHSNRQSLDVSMQNVQLSSNKAPINAKEKMRALFGDDSFPPLGQDLKRGAHSSGRTTGDRNREETSSSKYPSSFHSSTSKDVQMKQEHPLDSLSSDVSRPVYNTGVLFDAGPDFHAPRSSTPSSSSGAAHSSYNRSESFHPGKERQHHHHEQQSRRSLLDLPMPPSASTNSAATASGRLSRWDQKEGRIPSSHANKSFSQERLPSTSSSTSHETNSSLQNAQLQSSREKLQKIFGLKPKSSENRPSKIVLPPELSELLKNCGNELTSSPESSRPFENRSHSRSLNISDGSSVDSAEKGGHSSNRLHSQSPRDSARYPAVQDRPDRTLLGSSQRDQREMNTTRSRDALDRSSEYYSKRPNHSFKEMDRPFSRSSMRSPLSALPEHPRGAIHSSHAPKDPLNSIQPPVRRMSPASFTPDDTPDSPEPDEMCSFSPPETPPPKTIPVEKVSSSPYWKSPQEPRRDAHKGNQIEADHFSRDFAQKTKRGDTYRYEDFIGPASKLSVGEKKKNFTSDILVPPSIPKPPPLSSSLISSALEGSPVKSQKSSNRHGNEISPPALESNLKSASKDGSNIRQENLTRPNSSSDASKVKTGSKSQSSALNIEEYRRRRAKKRAQASCILDELIPETMSTSHSKTREDADKANSPVTEEIFTEDIPCVAPTRTHSPMLLPTPYSSNSPQIRPNSNAIQQCRDPRIMDGRQPSQHYSGMPQQPPYHSTARQPPHGFHASSKPPPGSVPSPSYDPRSLSRDPRSLVRHPPTMPGPRPVSSEPFPNSMRMAQPRARIGPGMCPPYGTPHPGYLGMYGSMHMAYPQPQSPTPPPPMTGAPEPVKSPIDLISDSFTCLIMKGLPQFVNSMHVYKFFQDYILKDVVIESDGGFNCTGSAYIQFPSHESAAESLKKLNGYIMHGFQISLGVISAGFFRKAKNSYGSRNYDRERRLGIPALPAGNCNPFYDPKRTQQKMAASLTVSAEGKEPPRSVSNSEEKDEPPSEKASVENSSVLEENARSESPIVSASKASDSRRAKDSESTSNADLPKTSKKNRRFKKIISPCMSDSSDEEAPLASSDRSKTVKSPVSESCGNMSDTAANVSVSPVHESTDACQHQKKNDFEFPEALQSSSVIHDDVLSDREDNLDFEEGPDFMMSEPDHSDEQEESELPELGDGRKEQRLVSSGAQNRSQSPKPDKSLNLNSSGQSSRKMKRRRGKLCTEDLYLKMTRKTQEVVEKVLIEEDKLKVSIPTPLKCVESLYDEKSRYCRRSRQPSKATPSEATPNETIEKISSEMSPACEENVAVSGQSDEHKPDRYERAFSDRSDCSDHDSLVIDLDASVIKEPVELSTLSHCETTRRTSSGSHKPHSETLSKVQDIKNLLREIGTNKKGDSSSESNVATSKTLGTGSDSKASAVVMVADSTISDDEPHVHAGDTQKNREPGAESQMKTKATLDVVVDSSQGSNELEVVDVESDSDGGGDKTVEAVESATAVGADQSSNAMRSDESSTSAVTDIIELDDDMEDSPANDEDSLSNHSDNQGAIIVDDDDDDDDDEENEETQDAVASSGGQSDLKDQPPNKGRELDLSGDCIIIDSDSDEEENNKETAPEPRETSAEKRPVDEVCLEDEQPFKKQKIDETQKSSNDRCGMQTELATSVSSATVMQTPSLLSVSSASLAQGSVSGSAVSEGLSLLTNNSTTVPAVSNSSEASTIIHDAANNSTAVAEDLDLSQQTDIFGGNTLGDDDLPDLSQIIPSINDDVLLNNLPDMSSFAATLTDPRVADEALHGHPLKLASHSSTSVSNTPLSASSAATLPVCSTPLLPSVCSTSAFPVAGSPSAPPNTCSFKPASVELVTPIVDSSHASVASSAHNSPQAEPQNPAPRPADDSSIDKPCATSKVINAESSGVETPNMQNVKMSASANLNSVTHESVSYSKTDVNDVPSNKSLDGSSATDLDDKEGTEVTPVLNTSDEKSTHTSVVVAAAANSVIGESIKDNSIAKPVLAVTVKASEIKPNNVTVDNSTSAALPHDESKESSPATSKVIGAEVETSHPANKVEATDAMPVQLASETQSAADSDSDDNLSVGLASISSCADDNSVVSFDGRDSKTPDSEVKTRRRKKITSSSSIRSPKLRRVTRGSIFEKSESREVVNWDDGGVVGLFQCELCPYVGRQHVSHIINYHPGREITCEFKKEDISVVFRDKVGPFALESNEEPDHVDLSWVPDGLQFEEAVLCNYEGCDYVSSIRFDLLYHYIEHYPKCLPTMYHCRLCHYMTNDLKVAYDHFTSHTGEYRYTCGMCGFLTYSLNCLREHHKTLHKKMVQKFTVDDPIMEDEWPYIYICKLCLFTQIQLEKVEAHSSSKHSGKAEIVKANMFRSIILHGERFKRLAPKDKNKGKNLGKKLKSIAKKVFICEEEEDEATEIMQEIEAKKLVERISQNIYTTRTVEEMKMNISKLESLRKKLARKSTDENNEDEPSAASQPALEATVATERCDVDAVAPTQTLKPSLPSSPGACDRDTWLSGSAEEHSVAQDNSGPSSSRTDDASSNDHVSMNESCPADDGPSYELTSQGAIPGDMHAGDESEVAEREDAAGSPSSFLESLENNAGPGTELSSTIEKLTRALHRTRSCVIGRRQEEDSGGIDDDGGDGYASEGSEENQTDQHDEGEEEEEEDEDDEQLEIDEEEEEEEEESEERIENNEGPPKTCEEMSSEQGSERGTQIVSALGGSSANSCHCPHPHCCFSCASQAALTAHQVQEHGLYSCSFYFCSYATPSEEQFIVHYQTHPQVSQYRCDYNCGETVSCVDDLVNHYRAQHALPPPSPCTSGPAAPCPMEAAEATSASGVASNEGLAASAQQLVAPSSTHPSNSCALSNAATISSTTTATTSIDSSISSTTTTATTSSHSTISSTTSTTSSIDSTIFLTPSSSTSAISSTTPSFPVAASCSALTSSITPTISNTAPARCSDTATTLDVPPSSSPCGAPADVKNVVLLEGLTEEQHPPGYALLPKHPPTVPISFLFKQYQTMNAFRMYTGRKSSDVFKCMTRCCVFTTNVKEVFTFHTAQHPLPCRCCYCLLLFNSAEELVKHVTVEHSHCGYMCKHCLYRSTSTLYLGTHMKNLHPREQPRYVKVTTLGTEPPPNPPVEKFIMAYRCGYDGCVRRTVDVEIFKQHVISSHGEAAIISCFLCSYSGTVIPLVQHMRSHMMDEFQCPYCLHGASEREKLLTHLVNCHPGRSGKVLLRKHDNPDHSTRVPAGTEDTHSAPATAPVVAPTTAPLVAPAPTTVPLVTSAPTTALLVTSAPTTVPLVTSAPTTAPLVPSALTTAPVTTPASTTAPVISAPTTAPVATPASTTAPVISAPFVISDSTITTAPVTSDLTTAPVVTSALITGVFATSPSTADVVSVLGSGILSPPCNSLAATPTSTSALPAPAGAPGISNSNTGPFPPFNEATATAGGHPNTLDSVTSPLPSVPALSVAPTFSVGGFCSPANSPVISVTESIVANNTSSITWSPASKEESVVDSDERTASPPSKKRRTMPACGFSPSLTPVPFAGSGMSNNELPMSTLPSTATSQDTDKLNNGSVNATRVSGNDSLSFSMSDENLSHSLPTLLSSPDGPNDAAAENENSNSQGYDASMAPPLVASNNTPSTAPTESSASLTIAAVSSLATRSNSSDDPQMSERRSMRPRNNFTSGTLEAKSEDVNKTDLVPGEKMGLSGHDLYRCGNPSCSYSSATLASLREHLLVCDLARDSPTLRCSHCGRLYRHLSALLDHIKVHGLKRFFCGVTGCTYRATLVHYFRNHMKQVHGTTTFKSEVRDPTVKDPENQEFIVTPRDHSNVRDTRRKRKNEYEVADIENIPRSHVSYTLLRCYHCTFTSKIRLNLIKHLKLHQKFPEGIPQRSIKVEVKEDPKNPIPNRQPVNPVPRLERKELMFDKMMNLAGSSFEDKKKMEEVDLRLKNPIPADELDKLPRRVADSALNACGVEGCKYISSDEIMLKYHIRSLHSDVNQFPCPHCKDTLITVEKISSHFKLHGEKLFRCGWCPYLSFRRPVVERHTREKHPSKRPFEFVIRDPDEEKGIEEDKKESIGTATPIVGGVLALGGGESEKPQWQCGLCRFQSVTQQAMLNHTSLKHDIKSQFKCGHCNVKSSVMTSFEVHFAAKHPSEKLKVLCMYYRLDADDIEPYKGDCEDGRHEPLWKRNDPLRMRHIRGILLDETSPNKSRSTQAKTPLSDLQPGMPSDGNFVCPKCLSFRTPCVSTFRSHLCKEADYHRYECVECGFTSPLLPSLRRHFNKTHHAQFHTDSYLPLPIDDEKEVWVESIISHHQHHIRLYKEQNQQTAPLPVSPPPSVVSTSSSSAATTVTSSPSKGSRLTRRSLLTTTTAAAASTSTSTTGATDDPMAGEDAHAVEEVPPVEEVRCDVCNFTCRSLAGLVSHARAHPLVHKCGYCSYTQGSKVCVEAHCRVRHSRMPAFVVKVEPGDAASDSTVSLAEDSDSADDHERKIDPLKPTGSSVKKKLHKCPDCSFESVSSKIYYKHCRTHVNNRPYLCDICKERFRDMRTVKQHHRCLHGTSEEQISFSPLVEAPQTTTPSEPTTAQEEEGCSDFSSPHHLRLRSNNSSFPNLSNPFVEPNGQSSPMQSPMKPKPLPPIFHVEDDFDELPDLEASSGVVLKLETDGQPSVSTAAPLVAIKKEEKLAVEEKPAVPTVQGTLKADPGCEFTCCHCGHKSDAEGIGEHIRSRHKDLPFMVRKSKGGTLMLEIYQYSCMFCIYASDSLMAAIDHWVEKHVTLDFQFDTILCSSQTISGGASQVSSVKSETSEDEGRANDSTSSCSPKSTTTESSTSRQPPNKRRRLDNTMDISVPGSSASEDDLDSERELDASGENKQNDSKFYRCSSCRRTSKFRHEIEAHQLEKHGGSRWCTVIELPSSAAAGRASRRLVKCRVCLLIGFRDKITQHGLQMHPSEHALQPVSCALSPSEKELYRCDVCAYNSKSRKMMQRHVVNSHGGAASYSRYADDAPPPPQSAAASAAAASGSSGEYRCTYCSEIIEGYEFLRAHHTFLHSHLPLNTNENDVISREDAEAVPLCISSISSISVNRRPPMPGRALKATARKSSCARGSLRRLVGQGNEIEASTSSAASGWTVGREAPPTDDDGSSEDVSHYGVPRQEASVTDLTTTINLGSGTVRIPVAHFMTLVNIDAKVALVDIARLFDS